MQSAASIPVAGKENCNEKVGRSCFGIQLWKKEKFTFISFRITCFNFHIITAPKHVNVRQKVEVLLYTFGQRNHAVVMRVLFLKAWSGAKKKKRKKKEKRKKYVEAKCLLFNRRN
jgi:hypothetical protein